LYKNARNTGISKTRTGKAKRNTRPTETTNRQDKESIEHNKTRHNLRIGYAVYMGDTQTRNISNSIVRREIRSVARRTLEESEGTASGDEENDKGKRG
jgi:hypothetical protein